MPIAPKIQATIVIVDTNETHNLVYDNVVQMMDRIMNTVMLANATRSLTGIPQVSLEVKSQINRDDSLDLWFVHVNDPTKKYLTAHAVKL